MVTLTGQPGLATTEKARKRKTDGFLEETRMGIENSGTYNKAEYYAFYGSMKQMRQV